VITALLEARETESWDDLRARVGEVLSLEGPVPGPVLRRMLAEPAFARDVLTCRSAPAFLAVLFADHRNAAYADEPAPAPAPAPASPSAEAPASTGAAERSNTELLKSAAGALLRWGKTGFSTVDAATFQRRWGACQGCPHLQAAPADRAVYRVKLSSDVDGRVCDACGCVASRKARLPSESCPVADALDPALNRWGEPLKGGALAATA